MEYWLAGIGTLVLALITFVVAIVKPWWNKPRFSLEFDNKEPYCKEAEISGDVTVPYGKQIVTLVSEKRVQGYWLRLKVTNVGRSVAKRCVGKLVKVMDESGKELKDYDPMILHWVGTRQNEVPLSPIDLNQKEHEFLDLIYTRDDMPEAAFICTDIVPRGIPKSFKPGEYLVQLTVYGDNVNPEPKRFRLHWGASDFKDIRLQEIANRGFDMRQSQIWIPVLYAIGVAFVAVSATILHTYRPFSEWIGWFNAAAGLAFIIGGGVWAFLERRRQS